MHLIILIALLAGASASPMQQSLSVNDDGTYQFFYETGKDGGNHKRSEVRQPDGVVVGKFSYEDPSGEIREVSYRADDSGYVANGDVSVEGAPKGQFPASPEPSEDDQATEPQNIEGDVKVTSADDSSHEEDTKNNNPKTEDIKDLPLDEPSPNDPPEAFPEGYFLQHFQGLRRLPEVTSEEEAVTEVASEVADEQSSTEASEQPKDNEATTDSTSNPQEAHQLALKAAHDMFMHLRPFQSFSSQKVDTPMFHQPVYVFSYQHPDSYGYHYFF